MYTNEQNIQYKKNLELLKKYNPAVYHAVVSKQNVFGNLIEWMQETDNFIIKHNDSVVFVHSQYDREREFRKIVEGIGENDTTVILFGLGNGRILDAIKKHKPHLQHLIIIEPNYRMVEHFFHHYDFMELGQSFGKISLILNKRTEEAEYLVSWLMDSSSQVSKKASVIATIAYRTLYPDDYKKLIRAVTGVIRFSLVNNATVEAWRSHWLINSWRNLSYLSLELDAFKQVFYGKPAILVSAGPSLKKNIHLLRSVYDKALIIAVGSSISILESHGIVPHFRAAFDAAVENEALFKNVDTSVCPLIYSEQLYYGVLPNYQGEKIHMTVGAERSLAKYMMGRIGRQCFAAQSGFSIANTTLDFLCKLGCSKVIFMGQDLCYTEGKLHAEGSWASDIEDKYINMELEAKDIFGNSVFTDKAFLGMKRMFENTMAVYTGVSFINATEGGLTLQGAVNMTFQDMLDKELPETYDYRKAIQEIILFQQTLVEEMKDKVSQAVVEMEDIVRELVKTNEDIITNLHSTHKKMGYNLRKEILLKEVKKIHTKFAKLQKNELYMRMILPAFEKKFALRRDAMEFKKLEWREQWIREVEIMLLEANELQEYLLLMQELIREYKGEKELKIIFQ